MPRVSRKQSELNRVIITETASRLFRQRGMHGVSLIEVMKASGLTHGGFYGHFESKEALANEACAKAFEQSAKSWRERVGAQRKKSEARQAIVDNYLSDRLRAHDAEICPVLAFGPDLAHEAKPSTLHQHYVEGLEQLLAIYQGTLDDADSNRARQTALMEYALMVGAMTLARAAGSPLADELLNAARHFLESNAGQVSSDTAQE
ncbi:TetR/AcrR family transcriptional regulator [Pseudomonas gingeri]|uniref:TetR/AcrR family transcriptional regulator n=1 Tax=Pseudomonas gingeri TaxID=117681 RepID=UPI0015A4789C|nr:TetR/AcrR family transcriptional regulator [Pseudomonas gingeri]NWA29678.1 TetR/AcrR family transcriptional regulator [Pseudomonas gingeri]